MPEFEKYMRNYDREAYGAGSQKDPATDRFSALDVRKMFDKGRDLGGSKAEVAEDVLDYAADYMGRTKMGGGTARALDRLRGYLKDGGESDQIVMTPPEDDGIPVPSSPRRGSNLCSFPRILF